jgi:hypothetical protein
MRIVFVDEEDSILENLFLIDRCIYHFFKKSMDLKTGIVGQFFKVSYEKIRQYLSPKIRQGSTKKAETYTDAELIASIKRLERENLIQRLSKRTDRSVIVKLMLGTIGNFGQFRTTSEEHQITYQKKAKSYTQAVANTDFILNSKKHEQHDEEPKNNNYIYNNIYNNNYKKHNYYSDNQKGDEKMDIEIKVKKKRNTSIKKCVERPRTEIDQNFTYTEEHVALAEKLGIEHPSHPDLLERFIVYHTENGTLSPKWNSRFSTWLLNARKYKEKEITNGKASGFSKNVGYQQQRVEPKKSYIDKIHDSLARLQEIREQGCTDIYSNEFNL